MRHFVCYAPYVGRNRSSIPLVVIGFFVGLFLASLDHIVPPARLQEGPGRWVVVFVDWVAPPLAGVLLAGALLYAQRARRLHVAERAAAQVLAERLAGTERRQAIWVVAAAIAHDVKNPLHNLALLVEELSDEKDPAAREELMQRVRENVRRASERVSELSRAGHGSQEAEGQTVDLAGTLAIVSERLGPAIGETKAVLHIECTHSLAVHGEAHSLRTAVENVAANALDAFQGRGGGGTLSLRAERRDGAVELIVEDDGPGIPEELQPRLFSPFSSGGSGTGLGLAIARALAQAAGGDLTCTSSDPGHTRFRFTFRPA